LADSIKYELILASASPRRQQILRDAGYEFVVSPAHTDESYPKEMLPAHVARYLAEKKARAFHGKLSKEQMVITADTTVVLGNTILNKPANEEEAYQMLRFLSGRQHEVITGVCLYTNDIEISFSDTTEVWFKELSDGEIWHYIKKYAPYDKAGSYGIQEWIGMIGINKISGSYFNVMGLPIHRVAEELKHLGLSIT
jgi:septum formation protein